MFRQYCPEQFLATTEKWYQLVNNRAYIAHVKSMYEYFAISKELYSVLVSVLKILDNISQILDLYISQQIISKEELPVKIALDVNIQNTKPKVKKANNSSNISSILSIIAKKHSKKKINIR
ncbi:MAG: hypothetical protein AB8U25_00860 [Rickettsiales endosymbiont of Dermacentor nuttalli]